MPNQKNVLFMSDFHCGHRVGLTPPRWQPKIIKGDPTKHNKFVKTSKALWKTFKKNIDLLPTLDLIVINGDLIDGKGKKSGGTEQITSSLQEQAKMASEIVSLVKTNLKTGGKVIATYGTDYHVGAEGDDAENCVEGIDKIGSHEWVDVNGLIFDIKHHLGSSGIPHGRHTASAKDGLWNDLWSLSGLQPRADVIIRSHVHYHQYCGTPDKLCMTLPALQGMGSKYGSRRCSGLVDFGFVLFNVRSKEDYDWKAYINRVKSQEAKAVKI